MPLKVYVTGGASLAPTVLIAKPNLNRLSPKWYHEDKQNLLTVILRYFIWQIFPAFYGPTTNSSF